MVIFYFWPVNNVAYLYQKNVECRLRGKKSCPLLVKTNRDPDLSTCWDQLLKPVKIFLMVETFFIETRSGQNETPSLMKSVIFCLECGKPWNLMKVVSQTNKSLKIDLKLVAMMVLALAGWGISWSFIGFSRCVTMTMGKFSSGTEYWKVGWEGILLKRARMTWMRRCHKIEQNSLSLSIIK